MSGYRLRLLKHTSLVWFSLLSATMIDISYQYLATDALASSNELLTVTLPLSSFSRVVSVRTWADGRND